MKKIAVLGFGVVGSGTVELFYKNKAKIEKSTGEELDIKYILDIREFPDSPYASKVVHDINLILNDDEVKVVAEVMGGVEPAFTFVKSCLEKNKSVVTSNKELVAKKGAELLKVAKEHNVNFFFEASVGGAIPIITPLHQCLVANDITEVAGILNGTTNYILTRMKNEKKQYSDILSEAQRLGYAEKDPTADVEGFDACRKICILASLAFGKHVYPQNVKTQGISSISLDDFEYADKLDRSIKLIGYTKKTADGKVVIFVAPCMLGADCMLSTVTDVFNAVMVKGDGIDKTMFYGRGAGKLPTASAVVADIADAVKADGTSLSLTWEDCDNTGYVAEYTDEKIKMYLRIDNMSEADAEKTFAGCNVLDTKGNAVILVTAEMTEKAVDEAIAKAETNGAKVAGKIRFFDI